MTDVRVDNSTTPIEVTDHEDYVSRTHCRSVVSFAWVVLDHDNVRIVMSLESSAHSSAADSLMKYYQPAGLL